MNGYVPDNVFNGTYGELWFDGDYMAETISCKAEVEISYEPITRTRKLIDGKKMTGMEGKGEVKLHKVSSYVTKKCLRSLSLVRLRALRLLRRLMILTRLELSALHCMAVSLTK